MAGANYARRLAMLDGDGLVDDLASLPGGLAVWGIDDAGSVMTAKPDPSYNGSYVGVTLGQPAAGNLRLAGTLDGANDYGDLYTPAIVNNFDPDTGTFLIFFKVSGAGVWTDGTEDAIAYLAADASNRIRFYKASPSTLVWQYNAGGTSDLVVKTSVNDTGYIMMAITWDTGADQMKAWYNGAQEGSTQTGLGTWVGNLAATTTLIGASVTTPSQVWDGDIALVALANQVWDIPAIYSQSGIG